MFNRLRDAISRAVGDVRRSGVREPMHRIEPLEMSEIDFRSLDPAASRKDGSATLVCPVTRLELSPDRQVFQCRACRTSYSAEGWDFLRGVDRGRCCACGQQNTIYPLP